MNKINQHFNNENSRMDGSSLIDSSAGGVVINFKRPTQQSESK